MSTGAVPFSHVFDGSASLGLEEATRQQSYQYRYQRGKCYPFDYGATED